MTHQAQSKRGGGEDGDAQKFLSKLNELPTIYKTAQHHRNIWIEQAHPYQLPEMESEFDWNIYLLLAGRGAGKTRAAAEWIWWQAFMNPGTRWLVAAPTAADLRDVCFKGDSGILSVCPQEIIENYAVSTSEITLIGGSIIKGIPASEPERYRGPQFHGGWCDELAAWEQLDEAWNQIQFGMRLGQNPRILCTTTPRPKPLIFDLVARDGNDVCYVSATTYDNLANLAPTFKNQILQYEGTSLGDQEINAVLLDPEDSGLIKRSWFKLWPSERAFPAFTYIIQSYDCATSEKTVNDATACIVLGVFKPEDGPTSVMIIDAWSERIEYPELRNKVVDNYAEVYGDPDEFNSGKKTDLVLIEDKSAGISLLQDLQRAGLPIRGYNPGRADKVMRANLVSPIIARGRVFLPESQANPGTPRTWLTEALNQWCAFPEVRNDDYVDALTQALRYLRDAGLINIDPLEQQEYHDNEFKRKGNPYAQ